MNSDFISQQDRIIVAAIEVISESGLSALTLNGLALRGNLQEDVIYKYFGGIDEVLVAVVEFFIKFDKSIMDTVKSKNSNTLDKIRTLFYAYATYYGNYKEISAVILHYEELLHNTKTRDMIAQCIEERSRFLADLIEEGMNAKEILKDNDPKMLADVMISIINGMILNRRVMYHEDSLQCEVMKVIDKVLGYVSVKKNI